jgi:hypothetical protein
MTSLPHRYYVAEPELYNLTDVKDWKAALKYNGYVVIKDILTEEEQSEYFDLFKKDWTTVSPKFNFTDTNTWKKDNCPIMQKTGFTYASGLSQCDFMWSLRTNPNIRGIYENLYDTNELVTSFDGFSVFLSDKQDPGYWLHIDQNRENPLIDEQSIQGAYNFFSVGEKDAGFVVVPNSHDTYDPPKGTVYPHQQFIQVDSTDPHIDFAVKLIIPKNCFILWNSFTIHGSEGMAPNLYKKELNRLTSYITYFPKYLRSDTIRRERMAGYYLSECCNHYATRHDVKGYPYGTKSRYLANDFQTIKTTLTPEGNIPAERLKLI